MINSIKNKYFQYDPNEFMPIYYEGKVANIREFHLLKLKKVALRADHAFQVMLDKAYAK